jgi:hypothetical protein
MEYVANKPTCHFFKWVIQSSQIDVLALVKKAFDQVEGDPLFESDWPACYLARDKLAYLLEDRLLVLLGIAEFAALGFIGDVTHRLESLTDPLLAIALYKIAFSAVAEEILVRERKWAPEKEPPEIV